MCSNAPTTCGSSTAPGPACATSCPSLRRPTTTATSSAASSVTAPASRTCTGSVPTTSRSRPTTRTPTPRGRTPRSCSRNRSRTSTTRPSTSWRAATPSACCVSRWTAEMPLDDDFLEIAARVRNWGRWGDDDELGTLNLIDDAAVQRGAACVQSGKTFNLSIPLDDNGPQIGFIPGRYNPIHKVFQINEVTIGDPDGTRFSDDQMDLALQACTHWDALSHSSYGGMLWNGHAADTITEAGAGKCGIGLVKSLVTRGVLLDIA